MSELDRHFHDTWIGLAQPSAGLVVSIPVLIEKQCAAHLGPEVQRLLTALCTQGDIRQVIDLDTFLRELLNFQPEDFDRGDALPQDLELYVPEGRQLLRPTLALRHYDPPKDLSDAPDLSPAAQAGRNYTALIWDLAAQDPRGADVSLDKPEDITGPWHYPPIAKFERLLRQCRVPIGLITNRRELRLVYAPHGESSGWIAFRVGDMLSTGGRPILDAMIMLLHKQRWFGVEEARALPTILFDSRRRQAEVTSALADQVFEALETLLRGFEAAAERDRSTDLYETLAEAPDQVYGGLLTVLLRLVFMLFAEDRGLLPVEHDVYTKNYSVLDLFEQLQADAGAFPDAMSRRFGAWSRLLAAWRAIFAGAAHGDLHMPPREGEFFDPSRYPFLEGYGLGGSSPLHFDLHDERARVRVPSIDDLTIYRVLERLLFLEHQRLSYRALDVEQIGSVYEALMGYHVARLPAPAVCLRPQRAKCVWVTAAELIALPRASRATFLQDEAGLTKAAAIKLADALDRAKNDAAALDILFAARVRGTDVLSAGRLVIQPGSERRRTSSHYTPRALTEPIVRKTLEPLLAAMGDIPSSASLLNLKICDPAMGSGAFLVAIVRALADQIVAAWTREGNLPRIADIHEDVVMHARRLVAQRCVYGIDKNPFAVNLAKLSLWLVTLARDLPFTFLDHALRCGDSLIGLSLDQITRFHWEPGAQVEIVESELRNTLAEAVALRRKICDLAESDDAPSHRERAYLLRNTDDLVGRLRLVADLAVGAFFANEKPKEREQERRRRLDQIATWLRSGEPAPVALRQFQAQLHETQRPFHWMLEFPEVFFKEREDPLDDDKVNHAAFMDSFVGNPPFAGKNNIAEVGGPHYVEWLQVVHPAAHGNADLSAHFFCRADTLIGDHGTIGLIATNTIGQGDTRATGLQHLVANRGYTIYDATRNMPWPEAAAAVTISIVHLARGNPSKNLPNIHLHDPDPDKPETIVTRIAPAINSRLRPTPERPDPKPLQSNRSLSFQGSIVLGMGFVLTPEEREILVGKNPLNAERILPYLGGEEVNTKPDQGFDRYVINFEQLALSEAEQWPDLLKIVREKVKPERDRQKDVGGRELWWRFLRGRPDLYETIRSLPRMLVTAAVSKHLLFSFQPPGRIFSHKLFIFPLSTYSAFACLQSRVHSVWTWLLSSTMKTDLNYSPTDCFQTFPFPESDPRTRFPISENIGEQLYVARAAYMQSTHQGLTKTYNALKDSACTNPAVLALRSLHLDLDRAILETYGWSDVEVPPYTTPQTPKERNALEAFEDTVLDRLFALNAIRANTDTHVSQKNATTESTPKTDTVEEISSTQVPLFSTKAIMTDDDVLIISVLERVRDLLRARGEASSTDIGNDLRKEFPDFRPSDKGFQSVTDLLLRATDDIVPFKQQKGDWVWAIGSTLSDQELEVSAGPEGAEVVSPLKGEVSRIEFRNFRSCRHVNLDLANNGITALVGPNSAGKTSLLHGIFLGSQITRAKPRALLSGIRDLRRLRTIGSTEPMRITLAVGDDVRLQFNSDRKNDEITYEVILESRGKPTRSWDKITSLGELRKAPESSMLWPAILLRFRAEALARSSDIVEHEPRIRADGEGLPSFLAYLANNDSDRLERLLDGVRKLVPAVEAVRQPIVLSEPSREQIRQSSFIPAPQYSWEVKMRGAGWIAADLLSEGTLFAFGMHAVLNQRVTPRMILMDDIDRGLHPRAQRALIQQLKEIPKNGGPLVVLTTHSPYVLDELPSESVRVVRAFDSGTIARPLVDHPEWQEWSASMTAGEFWTYVGDEWLEDNQ